ncbi:MAG: acyl carrier protein [Anaerolineae bacterium]|nr:acyl carrier protein [Anaerolineae bacterium]
MTDIERTTEAVFQAIDELNDILPPERRLQKSPDTVLYGSGGRLDSLELVNLIVAAEQNIEDEFGVPITLADERAMSQRNSPFRTVATLVAYITALLKEAAPVTLQA